MRWIGSFKSESEARGVGDYLYLRGIANTIEEDENGHAVWVHADDDLEHAHELLNKYRENPDDVSFAQAKARAEKERRQAEAAARRARLEFVDVRTGRHEKPLGKGRRPLTLAVLWICILTAAVTDFSAYWPVMYWLHADGVAPDAAGIFLQDVVHGQVWRLLTPALVHVGILHLAANMLVLLLLGGMVELRQGRWWYLCLLLLLMVGTNLAQYASGRFYQTGVGFGFSGAAAGLLTYCLLRFRLDPGSGLRITPGRLRAVLVSLVLGLMVSYQTLGKSTIAAYGAGMVLGLVLAWLSSGYTRILPRFPKVG